jgi:hypothetical protein
MAARPDERRCAENLAGSAAGDWRPELTGWRNTCIMSGFSGTNFGSTQEGKIMAAEIQFYDSVNPGKIPSSATHAALYHDGKYAATPAEAKRFGHVRWITVTGDTSCGIADYEPGNEVYEKAGALRAYVEGRHNGQHAARVYSDRSNVASALKELDGRGCQWWITTLDNKRWTAAELAEDLKKNFGVTINAADIWGNQYAGGQNADYDTSDLFGQW